MERTVCHECKRSDDEVPLRRCPMCHKHFCEEHGYRRSGLEFCSRPCGEYFFHVDPDE